jgi:ATPase family AAA domain-containing protein 3A/B
VLLYGPPGTGKTLYAKSLATDANMQYAIMSGGDVAPLGAQATYELNKCKLQFLALKLTLVSVFNWADKSKKGLVLFIDEAEAFLRPRDENMSPELRSVINTFLARTGEPSNK